MNELDLIREVEKRPILYNKNVSGFNKTKLRDEAWKEVQEALYVSETECKKRWRSLRDSFMKLQRTQGGRTRWPYHHAMRFLLPHIENKAKDGLFGATKRDSEDQLSDQEDERMRTQTSLPDLSFQEEEDYQPSAKKSRQSSTTDEDSCTNCNRTDPDELFLLSCASTLKRLNAKQNAVARLKIQQVLYEAEFGTQAALPMPLLTPASDCGFDSIDGAPV